MKNTSNSRLKRSQRDYTMAFKLLVIGQVEKGEFTYKQAQKHYGIQGRSTVLTWLRKYGTLDWNSPNLYAMSKGKETPDQKIKRLEKQIDDLKTLNMLNEAIIDKVDELTGSDFGKKLEAKYSEVNKRKKK